MIVKVTVRALRESIRQHLKEYHGILDDESYKKDSVIVPDETKDEINSYLKKMKLA